MHSSLSLLQFLSVPCCQVLHMDVICDFLFLSSSHLIQSISQSVNLHSTQNELKAAPAFLAVALTSHLDHSQELSVSSLILLWASCTAADGLFFKQWIRSCHSLFKPPQLPSTLRVKSTLLCYDLKAASSSSLSLSLLCPQHFESMLYSLCTAFYHAVLPTWNILLH